MRRFAPLLPATLLLTALLGQARAAETLPRYDLTASLDPATSRLSVDATISLPPGNDGGFLLNAALKILRAAPEVEEVPLGDVTPFFGNNGASGALEGLVKRYRLKAAPADGALRLSYEGRFDFGLSAQKEEYTRGFRDTVGQVGKQGVYLAGRSFWYPAVSSGLLTFQVAVSAPDGWHVISQGRGTSRDAQGRATWQADGPMDEIYLVGGPLRVWRDSAGPVETLVYLRDDDPATASKYLAATAQYLEMYRALIGPYPYGKFALVENFWETGYGMPSFTLLGSSIIRFPWILTSSYPHEILHNWWGNSVFVDYPSGNWCEGLTAYLADHLIQEQQGRGAEYRRGALQKYRNYVRDERDFPLVEFRSRESAATEAVGYGKTMMGFHMLRQQLGDEKFRQFLSRFYREYRGRQATFRDVQKVAESLAGASLARFFDDWIARPGAAALEVTVKSVDPAAGGSVVRGTLSQAGAPFLLDVPVAIRTTRGLSVHRVRMEGASADFAITVEGEPLVLQVDPQFDVFRRLDPREMPPSIGQIFGEPRITAVLPSQASPDEIAGYRELVNAWRTDGHRIEVVTDAELKELPADRAAWIFGRTNRLASRLAPGPAFSRSDAAVTLDGDRVDLGDRTVVVTARHPANVDKAVGWISVAPRAAAPGLARKLPHYGKYSFLAFEGDEPVNTIKGEWATLDSPLTHDLRPASQRTGRLPAVAPPASKALVELPPVFSQKSLLDHVAFLAASEREGRVPGSRGHEAAAEYIAAQMKAIGLTPGGEGGSFRQPFTIDKGPAGTPVTAANLIGYLPGTKADWEGQSVIVSAHYDHLGLGWPDAREAERGKVHPGADDNASGVAVLLELAKVVASAGRPSRSIVFVAFSGEEAGLAGSKHFVAHSLPFPLEKAMGVINIDTVGRLGAKKVSILGTGTASEWQHIFRGGSFVTGVESVNVPGQYEASDQRSFIERGIPGVQIFSGPHEDYHRPGDTIDKIDAPGLVKVAALVKEGVVYLAERAEPLTNTIAPATAPTAAPAAAPAGPAAQGRRVTFGAVPDFAFDGTGVRLGGVVAGSPAEQAGMKEGDVLVRIDEKAVASLRDFSEILRTLSPGQQVRVAWIRDGNEMTATVGVVAR
jgi:hypothetical protein